MTDTSPPWSEEWNGEMGVRWATHFRDFDRMIGVFGDQALQAAAPTLGERALDVGCGCGTTTLSLARSVGDAGQALGVDISPQMLEVARARASGEGLTNVSFTEADAAIAALPIEVDLVFSRFGVMFFNDPVAAFANIRARMRLGARLAFVCWREPAANPWSTAPARAVRDALKLAPVDADPEAPGPFAFANSDRVGRILDSGGFKDIRFRQFDAPVHMGQTLDEAVDSVMCAGPVSRLLRNLSPDDAGIAKQAVEAELTGGLQADGSVLGRGSAWIFEAQAG